jgi:hypothetical protein
MYRVNQRSAIFALAMLVLGIDWFVGRYIRFPITFVLPVFLMGWQHGRWLAILLASIMIAIRLSYSLYWDTGIPDWKVYEVVNMLIRLGVLVVVAYLADRVGTQERQLREEIKVLKGILPICSFCHKIRNEANQWERIDEYITEHTEAKFSHTFCPDCLQAHYGEYMKGRK